MDTLSDKNKKRNGEFPTSLIHRRRGRTLAAVDIEVAVAAAVVVAVAAG